MTFPFTQTAPAANQPPRLSQPLMQENFLSTYNILAVDHVTFGNATGGQHNQITFPVNVTPSTPTGISSVAFTSPGVADNTNSQFYWENQNATFPLTAIKAFALFAPASGTVTPLNSYNIASITCVIGANNYTFTITLNTNVTPNSNACVFINTDQNSTWNYSYASPVLTIVSSKLFNKMSAMVVQI